MPIIAVVGKSFTKDGSIELRIRDGGQSMTVPADQAVDQVKDMIQQLSQPYTLD